MNTEETSVETPTVTGTRVITAFLIFQLPDGQWAISPDLSTALTPDRAPHLDDYIAGGASAQVSAAAQLTSSLSAQKTMMLLAQQMNAMQEEAATNAIKTHLHLK